MLKQYCFENIRTRVSCLNEVIIVFVFNHRIDRHDLIENKVCGNKIICQSLALRTAS